MKTIVKSNKAPEPIGPYSQGVKVGSTLYVSGQISIDEESGELVTDRGIEAETHQVMKNLGYILEEAGLNFHHVVKCSIFVRDMGAFAQVNEAYGKYFPHQPPARETVEVSRLPKNVNVEVSCIASFEID